MGTANGLKTLNSGWQVWVNNTPASRNPSISSAASGQDPSQTEGSYRQNMAESWIAGSRNTGSWDDMSAGSQKMDSLSLPHVRQRQGHSGPIGIHGNGLSKASQLSPQRYEGGKDAAASSRYRGVSPSRVSSYGSAASSFSTQMQSTSPGGNYDSVQTSSIVENDLSAALRGMAVEDEFGVSSQNYSQQISSGHVSSRPNPPATHDQSRNVQQSRMHYAGYPQTNYSNYYTGQPSRVDYPYGYDAYRNPNDATVYANSPALSAATNAPPNVYPGMPQPLHHPLADPHAQQSGVFFDYSGSTRAPSQFYFHPNQPVLFPTAHPHSPMVSHSAVDKKRDFQAQYNMQHQQQMLFPNVSSSPSQSYHAADYAGQIPILVAGPGMYPGLGSHVLPYPVHGYPRGRREETDGRYRSAKLEEFRTNKTKKWELKEIYGHIVEFSSDQHGSRFIQQKLETATAEERQVIFDEIVPHNALRLIQDVFGNYVIQKLFEHGAQKQRTQLSNAMEGHILPLSLQMYGCRVVQKAIEHILPDQQGAFIKELEPNVLRCVKDANGNHVIQRLIECVGAERLGFVQAFRGNVYDLSTHPYGCRVLQRCFEHLSEEHTRALLDELHKYSINLMQDQFGNYVIQFVLQHGQPQDRALIISKLRGQMLNMARHKFASNVCEKALVTADSESRRYLIEEMMTPKQDGVNPIVTLMKDQYGNYVLQRALSVVESEQKASLVDMVRPQLANMRKYSGSYSKHLTAIERLVDSFTPAPLDQQAEEAKPSQ